MCGEGRNGEVSGGRGGVQMEVTTMKLLIFADDLMLVKRKRRMWR